MCSIGSSSFCGVCTRFRFASHNFCVSDCDMYLRKMCYCCAFIQNVHHERKKEERKPKKEPKNLHIMNSTHWHGFNVQIAYWQLMLRNLNNCPSFAANRWQVIYERAKKKKLLKIAKNERATTNIRLFRT